MLSLCQPHGAAGRLRHELEIAEAVLRGMKAVVDHPAAPAVAQLSGRSHLALKSHSFNLRVGGRQPGAISRQWRDTLALLYMSYPEGFTEFNAATAAREAGLPNVRPADAVERLKKYVEIGYVVKEGDRFNVSESAARKYGFRRSANEASHAETGEAS